MSLYVFDEWLVRLCDLLGSPLSSSVMHVPRVYNVENKIASIAPLRTVTYLISLKG